jgi:hypothetical protein
MTTTHTLPSPSNSTNTDDRPTPRQVVAGRIVTGLVGAFLAFDSVAKLVQESHAVAFADEIGAPGWFTQLCGGVLAVCLITYLTPRTATLGAVLLTGYLGGAAAVQLASDQPLGNAAFAIGVGVAVWAGLWPRDARARSLFR